jgi:tripartite-type tricarboxylate transporter receptor subunit TctC
MSLAHEGRVTMTLPNMSVVLPLVREGKLRALMAMTPARPTALPDVPTLAEAGFTGFDTTAWFGLMAPAGTPQPIIGKLYRETIRVLAQNDVRKYLQRSWHGDRREHAVAVRCADQIRDPAMGEVD